MAKGTKLAILCASDPYAVVGITNDFEPAIHPDLVTGVVTATSAGIDMVQKLTGIPTLNFNDPDSMEELRIRINVALFKANNTSS